MPPDNQMDRAELYAAVERLEADNARLRNELLDAKQDYANTEQTFIDLLAERRRREAVKSELYAALELYLQTASAPTTTVATGIRALQKANPDWENSAQAGWKPPSADDLKREAAPELYDALKAMLAGDHGRTRLARMALAKAEGRL